MFHFADGEIILIDKEEGWTSFDVVNYIKPAIWSFEENKIGVRNKIKIGHAGTLDPLASGLLVICTGNKTKEIDSIQALSKTYTGTFYIGATTESFDREMEINQTFDISHINEDLIIEVSKKFIGKQMQVPPIHSAVNINGKRAYQLARKNKEVILTPKPIEIYRFEITEINLPYVSFEVECSKGTYIRALARDFGQALQSGAYLEKLRRTKIGNYDVKDAINVKQFIDIIKNIKEPHPQPLSLKRRGELKG
ncbi:MAG: tRNA pseudouridine(55) synthase TruB [Bacteroidia bacterium]